jgi:hypothetical protein
VLPSSQSPFSNGPVIHQSPAARQVNARARSSHRSQVVLYALMSLVFALLWMAAAGPEAKHMRIVGHSDLAGRRNGGEGLALREYPNGRRILFLAHESAPLCFSVVDVTDVRAPRVINQVPTVSQEATLSGCPKLLWRSPTRRRRRISRSSASEVADSAPTTFT